MITNKNDQQNEMITNNDDQQKDPPQTLSVTEALTCLHLVSARGLDQVSPLLQLSSSSLPSSLRSGLIIIALLIIYSTPMLCDGLNLTSNKLARVKNYS